MTPSQWRYRGSAGPFQETSNRDGATGSINAYNADLREQIGLGEDSFLVLQPTRLVSRKGIEMAIELVGRLQQPHSALVIPHAAGDEGLAYQKRVQEYAKFWGVDLRIISGHIAKERGTGEDGSKLFTLWDVYPHADLVTYPSLYEGYGNALVEAVYFRKPPRFFGRQRSTLRARRTIAAGGRVADSLGRYGDALEPISRSVFGRLFR